MRAPDRAPASRPACGRRPPGSRPSVPRRLRRRPPRPSVCRRPFPPRRPSRRRVAAPRRASARPAPTEADRLREAVRLYETAQNTLDPDLYVRVFPGVDRSRVQEAFGNFRSQTVEFEIRKIEIDPRGQSAVVSGFESRLAVPKAGNEQRVNSDRVLHFEKRGDAWVITSIR